MSADYLLVENVAFDEQIVSNSGNTLIEKSVFAVVCENVNLI